MKALSYFENLLIFISDVSGWISVSAIVSLVNVPQYEFCNRNINL